MATHRITLTNAKGGIRTMTEQAWKNIPKDKQGTYNGWYPYEGQLSPSTPKQKAVKGAAAPSKQPPFIPQEVIDMRKVNEAKDAEIAALKAQLAAQNSVTEVTSATEEKPMADMKEIPFNAPVGKIDPAGNPVKTQQSKK